jgi:hypothetical protein
MEQTETAFAIREFSVIAYVQGHSQWHYSALNAGQTLAETQARGFFLHSKIRIGDMIFVSANNGGAILYVVATFPDVRTRIMCETQT